MSLPLDEIAAFDAVLSGGSLSAAARALNLSQPTLRARIAALEGRIGRALFTRGPTGLVPTAQARDLGPQAAAVLAAGRAFARAATTAPDDIAGTVRLTAPRVVAAELLPPVLAALAAAHPRLTVELAATDAVEDLARQDADVALRVAEPAGADLVARRLRSLRVAVFAAPALLDRLGTPPAPEDALGRWPWVWEDRARAMGAAMTAAGLPPPARVALASDDDFCRLGAVAAGLGLGFLQAGPAAARGLLPVCPALGLDLPLWLVVTDALRRTPAVRAVLDHLARSFA